MLKILLENAKNQGFLCIETSRETWWILITSENGKWHLQQVESNQWLVWTVGLPQMYLSSEQVLKLLKMTASREAVSLQTS